MKVFVLEDEIDSSPRNQIKLALQDHNLTLARSVEEAKRVFKGPYNLLLLDHDMEGHIEPNLDHPNIGMRFVEWLLTKPQPKKKPLVVLHSQNRAGRKRMRDALEAEGYKVIEIEFSYKYVDQLKPHLEAL